MSAKLRVQELGDALAEGGLDTAELEPVQVARLDVVMDIEQGQDEKMEEANNQKRSRSAEKMADNLPSDDMDKVEASQLEAGTHGEASSKPASKRLKIADVDRMLVPELKIELCSRGLHISGKIEVLKKRLKAAVAREDGAADDYEESSEDEENIVKATMKGRAVLDAHLPDHIRANFHVLQDGDDIYEATLIQTNVEVNTNKFYVIQALEGDKCRREFCFFTRWGRVGSKGRSATESRTCRNSVVQSFLARFQVKTQNRWSDRRNFELKPGKYMWIELDYKPGRTQQAPPRTLLRDPPPLRKLNRHVERLICEIYYIRTQMMQQHVMEIGYDARKVPLGKLSTSTILKGFHVLKRIETALGSSSTKDLNALSREFYSVIPHNFGRQHMRNFVISTPWLLKKKLEMVVALGEIEVVATILGNNIQVEDLAFFHYRHLKCTIETVPSNGYEASWVTGYFWNAYLGTPHHMKHEVQEVFRLYRENEFMRYMPFARAHNRTFLWHGSRLSNWTGILSQGLRIAPPGAPTSGHMFGKGVYFADMASKSANYCCTTVQQPIGILLLCEVALGDMRELNCPDYRADQLPPGKLSIKGLGRNFPDPSGTRVYPNGALIPNGRPVRQPPGGNRFQYNEYVVYNTAQIVMKYLLMVKFDQSIYY